MCSFDERCVAYPQAASIMLRRISVGTLDGGLFLSRLGGHLSDITKTFSVLESSKLLQSLADALLSLCEIEAHRGTVNDVSILAERSIIITCGEDFLIKTWNLKDGVNRRILRCHTSNAKCLSVCPKELEQLGHSMAAIFLVGSVAIQGISLKLLVL
ncbi:topless-related protein 1 [Tanacetum coccineum]